jgi:predicted DNA-binding protein
LRNRWLKTVEIAGKPCPYCFRRGDRRIKKDEKRCRPMIYNSVLTMYVQQVVEYMTKKVNFRLPDELIEKADVAAQVSHKNRTQIITEALQEYLQEVEDEDEFRDAVVELYLDNEISFEVLKEFIGRQDAESVRASKNLLDQGDELADELAELYNR